MGRLLSQAKSSADDRATPSRTNLRREGRMQFYCRRIGRAATDIRILRHRQQQDDESEVERDDSNQILYNYHSVCNIVRT